MSDVSMHFKPEFLNRIDESVIFHALGHEHISGGLPTCNLDCLKLGWQNVDCSCQCLPM